MEKYEDELTSSLISRLKELGYPADSMIPELAVRDSNGRINHVDLAIIEPINNTILAIFEVKRDLSNKRQLKNAFLQVKHFSENLSNSALLFLYSSNDNGESIYSVDAGKNDLESIGVLPSYESLLSSSVLQGVRKGKDKKKDTAKKWSNIVAGMASSIAVAATVAMSIGLVFESDSRTLGNKELTVEVASMKTEVIDSKVALKKLENELTEVKVGLNSLSSLPDEQKWKIEVSKLHANVSVLSEKLTALESALTTDPAKALAVPILRKDLENTEKTLKLELLRTRAELERMYDQNKWFIGLMFTIALSVLGMVASSWFNRKDT